MTLRITRLLSLATAALAASCTVTETGNPPLRAQMALTAETSDPSVVSIGGGASPSALIVHSAWIGVGDIRFVRAEICDVPGETEIDVPGPIVADVTGAPYVVELELDADDYCRVRVPLDRVEAVPTGAPAELLDHSIVITGERADGTPFRIASRIEREADIRARTAPFALDEAQRAVVLAFDFALWLGGIDLAAAVVSPDGTIVVDEDDNRDVLDAFEANADRALRLFRDIDEDGALDVDERAELLASGA